MYSSFAYKTWISFNMKLNTIEKYCGYGIAWKKFDQYSILNDDNKWFGFWLQLLSRFGLEKISLYSTINEKIYFHFWLQQFAFNFEKFRSALVLHRQKNILVSDYSTTMVHGTWKNSHTRLLLEKDNIFFPVYSTAMVYETLKKLNRHSVPTEKN